MLFQEALREETHLEKALPRGKVTPGGGLTETTPMLLLLMMLPWTVCVRSLDYLLLESTDSP